jgi:hypothetical protein
MQQSYDMPLPEPGLGYPQPHDATLLFPISFVYNGFTYHAEVLQREATVVEYLVVGLEPGLAYVPDPFVVASNLRRDLFDFPVNETYYPVAFGKAVVEAIEHACLERGLPVFPPADKQQLKVARP